MKFVIEHMEDEMHPWCIIEYSNISGVVGKDNLIFTNVAKKDVPKLRPFGEVRTESVNSITLNNACILDPNVEKVLSPSDNFDYLILGGILGDHPPRRRTDEVTTKGERRNLGKLQMSTDNAAMAAKLIAVDHIPFDKIKFMDEIEIPLGEGESILMPYRYVVINGKPFMSPKLLDYLKEHPMD